MEETLTKRKISVTLEKRNTDNSIEYTATYKNNLDVKFSYTRFLGNGMFGRGKVSICGLSMDQVAMFTSFWSEDTELAKKKIVKVSAGYETPMYSEESTMGTIIEGSIVSAIPTMPPDIWLNCEVVNSYETKFQTFSFSMKGKYTLKKTVENIAQFLKLEPEIRVDKSNYLDRELKNISFIGDKFALVNKIEEMFTIKEDDKNGGIIAYIEDNKLIVDYSNLELNQYNRNGAPVLIDKAHGMVGVPEPMWAGQAVKITTLLNPAIKTGDVIQLKSDLIPSLNGYYYVFTISYEGQFRGNNWYSSFVCKRLR